MLKDLKILNGEMPLEFDPLNTVYTINMDGNDKELEFEYKIDENDNISIVGNDLREGENNLVITVYNDEKMMSYYLTVYCESTSQVNNNLNEIANLELASKEIPSYIVSSIGVICFLTILLFFTLLFKKTKNYRFK